MTVSSQHTDYTRMLPRWRKVSACCEGQAAVKAMGKELLPAPKDAQGHVNEDRYKDYLTRAIYTNYVGRTKYGLSGAAFRKNPRLTLPPRTQYLENNANGAGQSLVQFSKKVFNRLLCTGRHGILVDYPDVPQGLTAEQTANIRASMKHYTAASMINWRTEVINGVETNVMIVLEEQYNAADDEFKTEMKKQHRVLRLRNGLYTQQVYRDDVPYSAEKMISGYNGMPFEFIPFFVVGSESNDIAVDPIPLEDIASVNVGHYINSADMEESAYIAGQATPHVDIGIMDEATWKELNGNTIEIGSRRAVVTQNGKFDIVQAAERNIYTTLREEKRQEIINLGSKIVEKRNVDTATQAVIDAIGENSVLSDLVANTEEAINVCLGWVGQFMGEEGAYEFKMNRDFFEKGADSQMILAAIGLYDRNLLRDTDMINVAKDANILEEDEDAQTILDALADAVPRGLPRGQSNLPTGQGGGS